MIQFLIETTTRFSAPELAQMAIEGGCQWIELSPSAASAEQTLRQAAEEIIPLCQESGAFLTITDDVDLAEQLHVHGITLHSISPAYVASVRERLGPEAVIGVWANEIETIKPLVGLDVDYVLAKFPTLPDITAPYMELLSAMAQANVTLHLVVAADLSVDAMRMLKQAGVAGFAVSKLIEDAEDPVVATRELLASFPGSGTEN